MAMQQSQEVTNGNSKPLEQLLEEAAAAFSHMRLVWSGVSANVYEMSQKCPSYAQVRASIEKTLSQSEAEELKHALETKPDLESMPPPALQFYTSAAPALANAGLVLSVSMEDWYANAEYAEITMKAAGPGTGHGSPILANFIFHKKTGLLAKREDILKAIKDRYSHPDADLEPGADPEDQPIYGLEISVADFPGSLIAEAILEEFRKTDFGKSLFERKTVLCDGPGDYGFDSKIFYLPQTREELTDTIPKEFKALGLW